MNSCGIIFHLRGIKALFSGAATAASGCCRYSVRLTLLLALAASACFAADSDAGKNQKARAESRPAPSGLTENPILRDTLVLRNGDILHGRLQSIEPQGGVRWNYPDALELIEFRPEAIAEIQFGERARAAAGSTNACQVVLTNQDALEGNLALCDGESVILETWYAGKVTIPRKMVQFILPRPPSNPPLFEGPDGTEGWTMGNLSTNVANAGQWRHKNGAFYATQSASIARNFNLPDVASIQFELAWKDVLHVAVALYTDYLQPISLQTKESEPDFGGFYSLQISSYAVNLLPITKGDPIRYLGPVPVPAFSQKNKAQIEIRVNKPKRIIALLVDGTLVKQWVDTEDFVGKGTGLRFVHQGMGAIKLAKLRIAEWDGQFEETPSPNPNGTQDTARLANGDRVIGDVITISDGKMAVGIASGKLDIPMNRVRLVEFAGQKAERAPTESSAVKAWFRLGGSITFQLEKWDDHGVAGTSPNLGSIVFKPAAFERLQFNANPFLKRTVSISDPPAAFANPVPSPVSGRALPGTEVALPKSIN